jgi:hypothetical protein
MEGMNSRTDAAAKIEESDFQSTKKTSATAWYKWLLAGVIAGLVGGLWLTSPLSKLLSQIKNIFTFLKR